MRVIWPENHGRQWLGRAKGGALCSAQSPCPEPVLRAPINANGSLSASELAVRIQSAVRQDRGGPRSWSLAFNFLFCCIVDCDRCMGHVDGCAAPACPPRSRCRAPSVDTAPPPGCLAMFYCCRAMGISVHAARKGGRRSSHPPPAAAGRRRIRTRLSPASTRAATVPASSSNSISLAGVWRRSMVSRLPDGTGLGSPRHGPPCSTDPHPTPAARKARPHRGASENGASSNPARS